MITWLVCFDIEDDRVRNRVGKTLLEYGERVQRSVFEIVLRNQPELDTLVERIEELAGTEANVRFYRVCVECRNASHTLARDAVMYFPAAIII